jgi:hypothetical protein
VNACIICSATAPTDGVLIDGSVFHNRCLRYLKEDAEALKLQEIGLQTELRKPPSLVENISMFFFQARQVELLATKQKLAASIRTTHAEYEIAAAKIRLVYDVWPTYPPDWDERRELVSERDHYSCTRCGVSGNHHLHHIRALSQGGTNRLDNIALLCESCHSEAHGGRQFRYEHRESVEPTTIERKIDILNRALTQRKDIHFHYKKPDGTLTRRRVTPRKLRKLSVNELRTLLGKNVKIEKEGKLCLFGHCHLRHADRTFAVHRMQQIEVR